MRWGEKRYHSLDYEMKKIYGEKIYRISLDGGMSCPNRDPVTGEGGCIFCSAGGSGDFAAKRVLPIREQIEIGKAQSRKKTDCTHFIAYFQAYTNTYAPLSYLREIFMEAITHPDIVILSIATRPDCLSQEVLSLLEELNRIKPVWIELGLQTIHEQTAAFIGRGYPLSCYEKAIRDLKARNLFVITHLILGLPYETREDMLASVSYLASTNTDGVKLQLLHILRGTPLADIYEQEGFVLLSMDEYVSLIADALALLPPDMVIHRLTGDGPRSLLLAPLWSTDKKRVLNSIQKELKERNIYQGQLFLS